MDEEDVYRCFYRHCFLAQCVEEPSVALKKLHAYHPGLAHGVEPKAKLAELGSAVRAPPEFWERGKPDCRCTSIFARGLWHSTGRSDWRRRGRWNKTSPSGTNPSVKTWMACSN
ncbi:putative syntaxin binding protein [Trypanosoma cruzi]|nr:putative syntaxin binding protein [Trypanosoma cruzi]